MKTDAENGKFWPETGSVFGKRELAHSLLTEDVLGGGAPILD